MEISNGKEKKCTNIKLILKPSGKTLHEVFLNARIIPSKHTTLFKISLACPMTSRIIISYIGIVEVQLSRGKQKDPNDSP